MFAFGQMGLSTRLSTNNVEFAGLAADSCPLHAYTVFTKDGSGVTVRIILFGISRNGAAKLAVNVEGGGFRRIVEKPNVNFRRVLRYCEASRRPARARRATSISCHAS